MSKEDNQRILKSPIVGSSIDPASRVAVNIELLCLGTDRRLRKSGSGTGFFHRYNNIHFLITNWHVVTGRNVNNPSIMLDGYPDSPAAFQLNLPTTTNPHHYVPSIEFSLYEEGKPIWIETRIKESASNQRVDLVAIPLSFPEDDLPPFICIEDFPNNDSQCLRAGCDVVIVGYPFGISADNPYPIWKRGFVASEPSRLIGGQMKYYIDTPGRPGMSGSPVFIISDGLGLPREVVEPIRQGKGSLNTSLEHWANAIDVNVMRFAGIYSGSVGDANLERLRLGVAWHAILVDELFQNPVEGSNPFPPVAIDTSS